ncbi:Uncharacterised protein [Yersinia intermedia]|nr:Uncharacterised protein [Yersinia intermedia]
MHPLLWGMVHGDVLNVDNLGLSPEDIRGYQIVWLNGTSPYINRLMQKWHDFLDDAERKHATDRSVRS